MYGSACVLERIHAESPAARRGSGRAVSRRSRAQLAPCDAQSLRLGVRRVADSGIATWPSMVRGRPAVEEVEPDAATWRPARCYLGSR